MVDTRGYCSARPTFLANPFTLVPVPRVLLSTNKPDNNRVYVDTRIPVLDKIWILAACGRGFRRLIFFLNLVSNVTRKIIGLI